MNDTPQARLSDQDLHFFGQGDHRALYRILGAHPAEDGGSAGTRFAVWAPNAREVSVVGSFNGWGGQDGASQSMRRHDSGVWEIFIPGVGAGETYKYEIVCADGVTRLKADPFALYAEQYPGFASIVHDLDRYQWSDSDWMQGPRASGEANSHAGPMATYEVHLGSWRRDENGDPYDYHRLSEELVSYVSGMGYTHVEFLPPTEHPFGGSWGYQPLGLYAPTSRFGSPDDFKRLVDSFHRAGIAVVMDWVPAHFPSDEHGLARFDGTALYEHEDPRRGYHPDWNTLIFNLGRKEVSNYLFANALFWLREYHVDALRVDAVASMLYLDYSREEGEWLPNEHGGNENLESVAFLKSVNELVHEEEPGVTTIAEESTSWPMVSAPTYAGGLGFGYKWNMGWMHDTLEYMKEDPVNRAYHHDELTFSLHYAFSENFVLPLSHDEVVHGKGSLIDKMPGDQWQKLANLRVYYALMYSHPGKKLLFMGDELAQPSEWNHDSQVDWGLQEDAAHAGIQRLVRDLNTVYRGEGALHEVDHEPEGFEWIEGDDRERSVVAFLRHARSGRPEDSVIAVCNFTPVVREGYRIGVPLGGSYREALNTDARLYGGSDVGNGGSVEAEEEPAHGRTYSLSLTLPPLGAIFLKPSDTGV